MSRRTTAAAVVILLGLVPLACGVPDSGFEAIAPEDLPARLRPTTPEAAPTTNPAAPWIAEVFWVRGDTLVPVAVTLGGPVSAEPLLKVLAEGPSGTDAASNVRTAFQDPGLVQSAEVDGDTVVVDLDERFATTLGSDQVTALGQLVFSLTSMPGVERVRFTVEGEDVAVPTPVGDVVERPVTREDYVGLIDLGALIAPS